MKILPVFLLSFPILMALKPADGSQKIILFGDSITEIQTFLQAGIDGFFTDDSAVGREAIRTFVKK